MNAGGSEMFRNRAYFGKKQHCNGVYIKPPGYCILITGGKKDMVNLPAIDMKKTGENINRLRKQAGLSVKDLQGIFGFATPQAIYKWQQGAALPTIDNLVVLAAVFQVPMDDILVIDAEAKAQISAWIKKKESRCQHEKEVR